MAQPSSEQPSAPAPQPESPAAKAMRRAMYEACVRATREEVAKLPCQRRDAGGGDVGSCAPSPARPAPAPDARMDVKGEWRWHATTPIEPPADTTNTRSEGAVTITWGTRAKQVSWWALLITVICLIAIRLLGGGDVNGTANDSLSADVPGVGNTATQPDGPTTAALEHVQAAKDHVAALRSSAWYRLTDQERQEFIAARSELDRALGALEDE